MVKVILDTNFVTIPFQFKVDIYSEFERILLKKFILIFPNICLNELIKLEFGKPALDLMKNKGVKFVDVPKTGNIDQSILDYAEKEKALVATQDIEMKKKALKKGLTVITLRQKQFLTKVGGGLE